jgi:hypothetical protein
MAAPADLLMREGDCGFLMADGDGSDTTDGAPRIRDPLVTDAP